MVLDFRYRDVFIEIPDAWWSAAGMEQFERKDRHYKTPLMREDGRAVVPVRIEVIAPVRRRLSHGVFNDERDGPTAQERVECILKGFVNGSEIPPIELTRLSEDPAYRFKVYHGAHRFYCSVAAGFTHVPAVERSADVEYVDGKLLVHVDEP